MKGHQSLRLRVTVGIALLTFMALGIHSLLLFSYTDKQEEDFISQIVTEELKHFIVEHRRDPTDSPPDSGKLKGYLITNPASRSQLPPSLRDLPPGEHELIIDGEEHHVAVSDEPEGRFLLVYNVQQHEERERNLIILLLLGTGLTALITAAMGYWAAGWLVRPVRALAQHVERLGPGRPASSLVHNYNDEEIQRLARAFDDYLNRVADLMQREQEFTANISHELRTPLTAIRTGCELLLQDPALPGDARRRIEAIDRAAGRLAETARSLLFLARGAGDSPRLEELSIQECVDEAVESTLPVLARKDILFETVIDPSATVRAERTALLLVVDNLLRNAAYYTEQGRVRAIYRDGCLTIEDTGPGMDVSVLPHVGERYYRGADVSGNEGFGLGLAIVKRICERFNWRIEITSSPGVGTRVNVHFPLPSSQNLHNSSTIS